jgi:hypothetical protein
MQSSTSGVSHREAPTRVRLGVLGAAACVAAGFVVASAGMAFAPVATGFHALDLMPFPTHDREARRGDRLAYAPGVIQGFDRTRWTAVDLAAVLPPVPDVWNAPGYWPDFGRAMLAGFERTRFGAPRAPFVALRDPLEGGHAAATQVGLDLTPALDLIAREQATRAALAIHRPEQEVMEFGRMRVARPLVDTVLHASIATDVDPVYMMALADKESSFLPEVRASTSTAQGLYQFIESTWFDVVRAFGPRHGLAEEARRIVLDFDGRPTVSDPGERERLLGLRRDPYLSAVLAAEMKRRDSARIGRELGRDPTPTETYLLHFLGVEAASRFLRLRDEQPAAAAARIFPAAARANRALFYLREGRRTRSVTMAEFYERVERMIARRLDRYGIMRAFAEADPDGADLASEVQRSL